MMARLWERTLARRATVRQTHTKAGRTLRVSRMGQWHNLHITIDTPRHVKVSAQCHAELRAHKECFSNLTLGDKRPHSSAGRPNPMVTPLQAIVRWVPTAVMRHMRHSRCVNARAFPATTRVHRHWPTISKMPLHRVSKRAAPIVPREDSAPHKHHASASCVSRVSLLTNAQMCCNGVFLFVRTPRADARMTMSS